MTFLVDPPALPVRAFHDEELAELNAAFERWPAPRIIEWAVEHFAPHLCLAASMQDAVLIDLATRVDPAIEVVFIDTGYHFPETLETVEAVRRRYGYPERTPVGREPLRGIRELIGRVGRLEHERLRAANPARLLHHAGAAHRRQIDASVRGGFNAVIDGTSAIEVDRHRDVADVS